MLESVLVVPQHASHICKAPGAREASHRHTTLLEVQDAVVGARAHGTVTGATALGVFVAFYKGLSGLVHERALGLAPDQTPEDAFKIGQVRHHNPHYHQISAMFALSVMPPTVLRVFSWNYY